VWATSCRRLDTVRWLLDHGADVNQCATFGGPGHGEGITALHIAAEAGDLPIAQLLCDRGADLTIKDRLYDSTPVGWADHNERTAVRDYLLEALAPQFDLIQKPTYESVHHEDVKSMKLTCDERRPTHLQVDLSFMGFMVNIRKHKF